MNSRGKAADTGSKKPDSLPPPIRRPALCIRILTRLPLTRLLLTRLLTALHDSRTKEAAGVVWRHRDFRRNFRSMEHADRANLPVSTPHHRRQARAYELEDAKADVNRRHPAPLEVALTNDKRRR